MVTFGINYIAKGNLITLFILGKQHNFSNFYNFDTVKIIYTHNLYYHYYYLSTIIVRIKHLVYS